MSVSSVSGLRGVREALAELFELIESGELVRDISRDGESDWLRRAAKLTLTLKKAQLALSLPPSPQAPDNRDFQRAEGLYLKLSEPLMEPKTPVIIERVNGDCSVSQFIIARDEAHGLIEQMREFLHVAAAPSAGSGQEGLEAISAKVHEQWMENKRKAGVSSRKLESGEELMVSYDQLSEAAKELDRGSVRAVLSAQAALLPPAPKPAPPAEPAKDKS